MLPGRELALTFASLRANDLIWHYVVNNYLKGRQPEAFDLLYWNADSTNLPGVMYAYYLRNMYLENNLRVPGRLTMCGVPVDLGTVDMPAYVLATREDHIVPWRTAYASTRLLKGRIEFVLAAQRAHRRRDQSGLEEPAQLLAERARWTTTPSAGWRAPQSHPGSWWPHWSGWLAPFGGARVAARDGAGRRQLPGDRGGPRTLREGEERLTERSRGARLRDLIGIFSEETTWPSEWQW